MGNKRITFALTIGGSPKASSIALNNRSIQQFNSLMSQTVDNINGVGNNISKVTNDMRRLDKEFNRYGNTQLKNFQSRFIKNPKDWPGLSEGGMKIRRYKLNPDELKKDILNASKWVTTEDERESSEVKLQGSKNNLEPILTKFFNSIPKIRPSAEANVTPLGPALLFTGKLKNSMYFDYQKRTYKGKKSVTYRRVFKYGATAPYAEAHFTGGLIDKPILVIHKRNPKVGGPSYQFKFIIPIQFVRYFNRLDLGDEYEVNVEMKKTKVYERNPFTFEKEDKEDYDNFMLTISEDLFKVEFGLLSQEVLRQLKAGKK